jgi:hypothetical protein
MFKTSVQEHHGGIPWGVISGFFTFAALLAAGYTLVTPGM